MKTFDPSYEIPKYFKTKKFISKKKKKKLKYIKKIFKKRWWENIKNLAVERDHTLSMVKKD